jgi:hypothetical protein
VGKLTPQAITAKAVSMEIITLFLSEASTNQNLFALVLPVSKSTFFSGWTTPIFRIIFAKLYFVLYRVSFRVANLIFPLFSRTISLS